MPAAVDVFTQVGAAIYTRLAGGSALMALIGNVAADHAREGETALYLVYRFMSSREDDSSSSETDILTYDVVVHDDADYPDGAATAFAEAHALLHNYRVATTTYNLTFRRVGRIHLRAPDGWWNVGGQYEIYAAYK